jgi:hypothetical protein
MNKVKNPKLGDYVLLSRWSDKSIYDPWFIGYLTEIVNSENNGLSYRCRGSDRYFKHCWRITKDEANDRFRYGYLSGA